MKFRKLFKDLRNNEKLDIQVGNYIVPFLAHNRETNSLDIKPFIDVARKLSKKMGYNPNDLILLSSGAYGVAFKVSDKHVMKITTDDSEATNVNRIRKKDTKGIVSYYDVRKIKSDKIFDPMSLSHPNDPNYAPLYVIIMDYIEPIMDPDARRCVDTIIRNFKISELYKVLDPKNSYVVNMLLSKMFPINNEHVRIGMEKRRKEVKSLMTKICNDVWVSVNTMKRLNIDFIDIKWQNMGIDRNGDYVFMDIGGTDVVYGDDFNKDVEI